MSNELNIQLNPFNETGLTLLGKVYNKTGTQVGANVSMSDVNNVALYTGDFALGSVADGEYLVRFETNTPDKLYGIGSLFVVDNKEVTQDALYTTLIGVDNQLGNIASGSSAISTVAESYTLTLGVQSSGTLSDTETKDGVFHQHTDSAGAMDLYYQFDVGGNGVGVEVDIFGYLNSNNDALTVYAYDWSSASWDVIGTLSGQNGTTPIEIKYSIQTKHTGTGPDLGKIRIRFYAATGLTSATLNIDRIVLEYTVITQSVGYSGGNVWVDTNDGTTGITSYVNGVADNPVNNLADAITIASNVGLSQFYMSPDSSITFTQSHSGEVWHGIGWACNLGGQDLSKTHITHAKVSGSCTSPSGEIHLHNCHIESIGVGGDTHISSSKLDGTTTLSAPGNYILEDCKSEVAGSSTPIIDMGVAIGASELSIRNWSGGLSLLNVEAGDNVSIDGQGGNITINGTGGEVHVRGIFEDVIDNSGGAVTIDLDADTINKLNNIQNAISSLNDISITDVKSQADQALVDYGADTLTNVKPSVSI